MVSEQMYHFGSVRSSIRELFEYGNQRAAVVGRENIFDFSLGNPSVPAPPEVNEALRDCLAAEDSVLLHGYTSAAGAPAARDAVAAALNQRLGAGITRENLYLTCGAAASLTSVFKALTLNERSEFIALAPYFPEYAVFARCGGGTLKVSPAEEEAFQIDFAALRALLNKNTQAVIVNSPNNPSGAVYSAKTLQALAALLMEKSREYGHTIYIVSDEPYRELIYGGAVAPYVPGIYPDTIVCYSYSKSLSLPGERIGYVLVPPCAGEWQQVMAAVAGAARSLGYVCAPSLMQRMLIRCAHVLPDLAPYERNRKLLYDGLTQAGYSCARPDGAFYLFVKAPGGCAAEFSERAKQLDILLVPGDSFGCPRYVRLCYAVKEETIRRALPLMQRLLQET